VTLRTTALIAGALGLLLLIGGLIADAMRPDAVGTPRASLETAVLVIGPDLVETVADGSVAIAGTDDIAAYAGRAEDVELWAATRDVTAVTGIVTWDDLTVEPFVTEAPAADPSASPSASPSVSASASASPEPSPSASPSASPSSSPSASASPTPEPALADIWRDSWTGSSTLTLAASEIPDGLVLVVESVDGEPLESVEFSIERVVNDGWVGPLKWWGGVLAFFGLVALVSLVIDMRTAGSKVESSVAARRPLEPAVPGGRRERREAATATNGIPVVAAPAEDWTGEVPVVPSPHANDAAGDDSRAAQEQDDRQSNDDKEDRA